MTKPITIAPLTGVLDTRSAADSLPRNALRWRQNWQTIDENKLRRGCGWTKLLSQSEYNNQDFHDQLLTLDGTTREPITLTFEAESATGIRSLFAATQSRIARLIETTGNWKIIGSGFGGGAGTDCSGPRFKSAVVGDYVIFTNDFDRPQYHRLEQPPFDDVMMAEIPDLAVIGLSKAKQVWAWKDVVFFADVEMNGERLPYMVVWGDYRNPLSFDPAKPESIAGLKPLNYGERVLTGGPTSQNTYLLYTTHRIWEITAVGGEQVFSWRVAYDGTKRDNNFSGILRYENTLVDIGGDHLYLSDDGPYLFNSLRQAPEPVEWLHRADNVLYDDLDTGACAAHIGWIHGREAFFSVKRNSDAGCPGVTLRVNTRYKMADVLDFGFTAACNFRSHPIPTIRDFIIDKSICDAEGFDDEMVALFDGRRAWENEGLPAPEQVPTAEFVPQQFWTDNVLEIGGTLTVASAGTAAANSDYVWRRSSSRWQSAAGYYITTTTDGTTRTWRIYNAANTLLYHTTPIAAGAWASVDGGAGPAPTITLGDDVAVTEDWEMATADVDSLCALLGDVRADDICRTCEGPSLLVLASSQDWCLKQYGGFHRERCANPTAVGTTGDLGYTSAVGSYILDGYDSILRWPPAFEEQAMTFIERFKLNGIPVAQDEPSLLQLRTGVSGQTADSNTDDCLIVWQARSTKELACVTAKTAAQHTTAKTAPSQSIEWSFRDFGRFIHIELKIAGTGGDCYLSGVVADLKAEPTRNY